MIFVGVALTCFNQAAYTRQALETLIAHTPCDGEFTFKFLLLDDCSTDDTPTITQEERFGSVRYWRSARNSGVTYLWNSAYQLCADVDYLLISNNDVIFTPSWCQILLRQMRLNGARMAGPVTNGPGHVPEQDVRIVIPGYEPSDDLLAIRSVAEQLQGRRAYTVDRINGFCMAFDRSLLAEADSQGAGTPFDPAYRDFGNDDEFQRRLRPRPLVVPSCFVFHYKRVSISGRPRPFHQYRGRI